MTAIVFVERDGNETRIEAADGESLMEAAVRNSIEGILAECGGCCTCGTCHVFVDEAFLPLVGEPADMEQVILEFSQQRRPNSRLACQVEVRPELQDLRVTVPEQQP